MRPIAATFGRLPRITAVIGRQTVAASVVVMGVETSGLVVVCQHEIRRIIALRRRAASTPPPPRPIARQTSAVSVAVSSTGLPIHSRRVVRRRRLAIKNASPALLVARQEMVSLPPLGLSPILDMATTHPHTGRMVIRLKAVRVWQMAARKRRQTRAHTASGRAKFGRVTSTYLKIAASLPSTAVASLVFVAGRRTMVGDRVQVGTHLGVAF